jgi:hypothetical protein
VPDHNNQTGYAIALDSETGKELWKFKMGSGVRSQPVICQVKVKVMLLLVLVTGMDLLLLVVDLPIFPKEGIARQAP